MKKRYLITALALGMILTGCNSESVKEDMDTFIEETVEDADVADSEETTDVSDKDESTAVEESTETSGDVSASAGPSGTYTRTYTEEIEGEEISTEFSYTFNADGTGSCTMQDTVPFTWDDKTITVSGETYEYKLEGNTLKVDEGFGFNDYTKQ